jgi:hypothetical protein
MKERSMPKMAILFGVAMVLVSLLPILASGELKSPTALIPAGFGAVLLVCGIVGQAKSLRKHAMHLAAAVSLLGGLAGSGIGATRLMQLGSENPPNMVAVAAILCWALLSVVFVALSVRTFIQARRQGSQQ